MCLSWCGIRCDMGVETLCDESQEISEVLTEETSVSILWFPERKTHTGLDLMVHIKEDRG